MQTVHRLSRIVEMMSGAPMKLRAIINYEDHSELDTWLDNIFDRFLPDAKGILSLPTESQQVGAFAMEWGRRYFPLDERYLDWICSDETWDDEEEQWENPWQTLRFRGLPYQVGGFDPTEDNLHFVFDYYSWQIGLVALMIGKHKDLYYGGGTDHPEVQGLRVSWMEAAQSRANIAKEQLLRIPEEGWDQDELTLVLRGTKLQHIGVLAAWVNNATGKDLADEYPCESCGPGGHAVPWELHSIEHMTRLAQECNQIMEQVQAATGWLSLDPSGSLEYLIDFIEERMEAVKTKPNQLLREVLANDHDGDSDGGAAEQDTEGRAEGAPRRVRGDRHTAHVFG